MTETVSSIYSVVAASGAFLSVYVMQKTEHDRINMLDASWVQWLRRGAFTLVSGLLLCSILYRTDIVMLMLVASGVANLAINAVALHKRSTPPRDNLGERAKVRIGSKVDKSSQWRVSPEWPAE